MKDLDKAPRGSPPHIRYLVRTMGGRLLILGTVHLAAEFPLIVENTIRMESPDLVLVELDGTRFGYFEGQFGRKLHGIAKKSTPSVLQRLDALQQDLGKRLRATPGLDMYVAVKVAQELHIAVEFIDLPIEEIDVLLQNVSEHEREQLIGELEQIKPESLEEDSELFGEILEEGKLGKMLGEFQAEYRGFAHALLSAREDHMVAAIGARLKEPQHHKILVICGLGHRDAICHRLEKS